jgi:unsaturated rhamnogalacturonyl hydrolase
MKGIAWKTVLAALFALCACMGQAQTGPRSREIANSAIERWTSAGTAAAPSDPAFDTLLAALDEEWLGTADASYFRYVKSSVDAILAPDGTIRGYDKDASNLDDIALGRELLLLYRVTQERKYFDAAATLRIQLIAQPRNAGGSFWHGRNYPGQMWVEDLYNSEPFNAEFANAIQQPQNLADITRQFVLFEQRAGDHNTGLLEERVGDPGKQTESNQPAESSYIQEVHATGSYMMALVDTLPSYPPGDGGRATLLAILSRLAEAVARDHGGPRKTPATARESETSGEEKMQSSAWLMISYAFAKAVRLGYLPQDSRADSEKAYRRAELVAGKGEIFDDPAIVGERILATREREVAPLAGPERGKRVLLDAWFNSQRRMNALRQSESFHYKWNDYSDSGFSLFGHLFHDYGMETDTLDQAPTVVNLGQAQFYILVSPDIPAKNPQPHYVTRRDAEQVAAWVKQGGILLMMENDPANADIKHLDMLADMFGIHFNSVLSHHVIGDTYSMGRLDVQGDGELFTQPLVLFMKDTCTITVSGAARSLLVDRGDVMMAAAKYGKGTVFAVVDPWIYNEYTDGRKLPPEYGNYRGAQALLDWLIGQGPAHEHAAAVR